MARLGLVYVFVVSKIPGSAGHNNYSISIKDFVRAKKSATEKRKSNRNLLTFINIKLNTKPLKFKLGLADGAGAQWSEI